MIGIFGTRKTYENLSSSFFQCFALKGSEEINVESNILARCALLRHEWCSIKTPVEGDVRLPLLSCLKEETCTTEHVEFLP